MSVSTSIVRVPKDDAADTWKKLLREGHVVSHVAHDGDEVWFYVKGIGPERRDITL